MSAFFSRFHRWPTAIVAVLAIQIAFGIWMARVAGSDPHFAIEPDYYRRAVNWDSTMAQSRRDRALGWRAVASVQRMDARAAIVRLTLTDSAGVVITPDSLAVEVLPVAHAGRVQSPALTRVGDGYEGELAAADAGLWDVSVRAVRGSDRFTARLRTELP